MVPMPTCFLVLGTPRSGTSCVAGVLHHLGVRMTLGESWDDADWNPKGGFQDAAIADFSTSVYGWPWRNPRRLNDRQRDRLKPLIDERATGIDWGVKDNPIAFYLADFIELCPDPVKLILTQRERTRSIESWQARTGDDDWRSTRTIEMLADEIAANTKGLPALTVRFDDLLDATEATVERIAAYVGKPVTDAALGFPDRACRRF